MKHATSRLLFAYWDALRGERAAPERGDVVPGAIRHVLADTFVLGVDAPREARFRLAGTRCAALFGRSLKDASLAELWRPDRRPEIARAVEIVSAETAGLVAGLTGLAENGWTLDLELLLLPLRHRGRTSGRILGSLSPLAVPSWIGLVPLVSVETRTLRVVGPTRDGRTTAREPPSPRRPRFVVLQGGLG